jgi:hypothetical protein
VVATPLGRSPAPAIRRSPVVALSVTYRGTHPLWFSPTEGPAVSVLITRGSRSPAP